MEPKAISALIIRGAEQYCDYLKNLPTPEDRGEEVHDVTKIDRYDGGIVMLHLKYGLTDVSLTALEIRGKRIDGKHYSYRSYDDFSRTLELWADGEISDALTNENKKNVKIVFDFKFLIKRICKYLEQYSDYLEFPTKGAEQNIRPVFSGKFSPGPDQKQAVVAALTEPASYVWGAPGTGKTQMVLANAILADIKAGRKVAVFAPTNNSVEQILRGLIKEIDGNPKMKEYVNLDKDILRVGYPSSAFQATFPNMCESRHIDKQGKVLNHTLRALWDTRNEMVIDSKAVEMKALLRDAGKYESMSCEEQDGFDRRFQNLLDSLKGIKVMETALREASVLNIKGSMRSIVDAAVNRPRPRRYMPEYAEYDIEMMDRLIRNVEQEYKTLTGKSPYKSRDVEVRPNFKSSFSEDEISGGKSLLRKASDAVKGLLKKGHFKPEEASAALETAKIIVCTPHQFFKRMIPACVPPVSGKHVLDVGHIYVDEAGYANLMHIVPLLTNHVPITLLGDHMQLETVFTMGRDVAIAGIRDGGWPLAFLWGMPAVHLETMFAAANTKDLQNIYIQDISPAFDKVKLSVLKKSYRFGDNLAKILDECVYERIGLEGTSRDGNLEIECIPVKSCNAFTNKNEADAISIFVGEGGVPDSTAILVPYRKQRDLIRRTLPPNSRCEVMTIHASQGREWDTVIVGVTDSKSAGKSFMDTKNHQVKKIVNTAVSRAKRRLIIVCNFDWWINRDGQLVTALIKYANDRGNCYTAIDDAVRDGSDYQDEDDDF